MEALELKTTDDLLASPEERVELINGEIVRRPMARAEHGFVQGNAVAELQTLPARHRPRRLVISGFPIRSLRHPQNVRKRPRLALNRPCGPQTPRG